MGRVPQAILQRDRPPHRVVGQLAHLPPFPVGHPRQPPGSVVCIGGRSAKRICHFGKTPAFIVVQPGRFAVAVRFGDQPLFGIVGILLVSPSGEITASSSPRRVYRYIVTAPEGVWDLTGRPLASYSVRQVRPAGSVVAIHWSLPLYTRVLTPPSPSVNSAARPGRHPGRRWSSVLRRRPRHSVRPAHCRGSALHCRRHPGRSRPVLRDYSSR